MTRDALRRHGYEQVASNCIAVRVRLINRVVTSLYDEALRPHGLRVSQGNILIAIACSEDPRPADICRRLRLERSTLSRDVEIMKSQGWLASDPPEGGRNQVLRVTPAGHDLLARARPAWESAQAEAKRLIGEVEVEALRRISSRLGLGPREDWDAIGSGP
jgi:DNA-binding MarR family transcriptional regulator